MQAEKHKISFSKILVVLASFVILVLGMQAAAIIVVPFLLAAFVAMIISPFYFWLQDRGIRSTLALLLIICLLLLVGFLGSMAIIQSMNDFYTKIPRYQKSLAEHTEEVARWLENHGVDIPRETFNSATYSRQAMEYVVGMIGKVGGLLTATFLILIVIIFMLLEAAMLPEKIKALPYLTDDTWNRLVQIVSNVRRYMAMKTLMSIITGLLIGLMLFAFGVDSPILLGILAFVLNFIPNVGSFVAGIPGVLLAWLDYGLGRAVAVTLFYVAINVGVSNFLEPRYMGYTLGLSPLVIIVTMFFWAWVLGPIGMLLAVPLTMAVKIILDSNESTQWIAMLMDSEPNRAQTAAAQPHDDL